MSGEAAPLTIEGTCLAVTGYEENYLRFVDEGFRLIGITNLVPSDLTVDSSEVYGFGKEATPWDDEMGARYRVEYQQRTSRALPPLLKVKITAEVVEASPEETAAYWAAEQQRTREIPHDLVRRQVHTVRSLAISALDATRQDEEPNTNAGETGSTLVVASPTSASGGECHNCCYPAPGRHCPDGKHVLSTRSASPEGR